MAARMHLAKTWPLAVVVLLLILVAVWQTGVLDPRTWLETRSVSSDVIQHTEGTLIASYPLVVEGRLIPQGEGVAKWEDWVIPYDRYELRVSHVWSGDRGTSSVIVAIPKSSEGVVIEDVVRVDAGRPYVFFLTAEPYKGMWEGMHSIGDAQRVWQAEAETIRPTVPHLKQMGRSEFAAFIAAENEGRSAR